jgi:hypothetical protein
MRSVIQLVVAAVVFAQVAMAADRPVVTRWMDPSGKPRPSHVPSPGQGALKLAGAPRKAPRGLLPPGIETNRICVIVQSNVYASISNRIVQYESDLKDDGFSPIVYRYDSGTAEDLRTYLAGLYGEPNSLKGAVLIGEIPYIIFEMSDTFSGSDYGYEDFPCDLFYMDLNGTWLDQTNGVGDFDAGKYDTRTGNLDAEIWVSRVKTANLSSLGNQTNLLINYFDKDHRYRTGKLVPNRRALVYSDDDWDYMAYDDANSLAGIYSDAHAVGVMDAETTSASDYKSTHMSRNYELMMIRSHGYATGHGFYTNSRAQFDYIYNSDYRLRTPRALFYSFFVCSGADFSSANNLAGTATFNTNDSGLVSWGSSKTGGMLYDDRFYGRIADGDVTGEAFRQWLNYAQTQWDGPAWFWGMVLLGDGSLSPGRTRFSPSRIDAASSNYVSRWAAVAGDKYRLQHGSDLVHDCWSNVCGAVTASTYEVCFTNPPALSCEIYRLVQDCSGPTNLLGNASFEMPGSADRYARHWESGSPDSHGSFWDNAYREVWRAHGDFFEAVIKGSWSGGLTSGGWWQEAAASAGATYRVSAWFWADKGGYGGVWTASSQELKIEFYSSSYGPALSTNTVDLSDVGETWTQKTVAAVAPAGAAWARFVVGVSGAGSQGALQFDDAELVRE